jgi:hypothetical protein
MKKASLAVLLIVGIGLCPVSNGMAKYIPEGSQLVGTYWGPFDGDMVLVDGIVHIELYQTPKGKKLITGVLEQEDTGRSTLFRGEMSGNTLNATLDPPYHGTISGKLSKDGTQLSGTFESIELREGVWKAKKE